MKNDPNLALQIYCLYYLFAIANKIIYATVNMQAIHQIPKINTLKPTIYI